MKVGNVLVTGANRGIGLEIVKQLIAKDAKCIFATYRSETSREVLEQLRDSTTATRVHPIKLDVTSDADVEKAAKFIEKTVGEDGLNLLVNNAGVGSFHNFEDTTQEELVDYFNFNTVGPIRILKAMLPLLKKAAAAHKSKGMGIQSALVINMSSFLASNSFMDKRQYFRQNFAYRISKAALNMAMAAIALDIKDTGVLVVQMCPGWVKTDMGTKFAPLKVEESVSALLNTWLRLNETHQGAFLDRHGVEISCSKPFDLDLDSSYISLPEIQKLKESKTKI